MRKLILFFLLLTACGPPILVADPELKHYIDRFQAAAAAESAPVVSLNLYVHEVDSLPPDTLGMCEHYPGSPEIQILASSWIIEDDTLHEILMFHELGHCVLGRGHNLNKMDGTPVSIMYPYILDRFVYLTHRGAYIHELFHPTSEDSLIPKDNAS